MPKAKQFVTRRKWCSRGVLLDIKEYGKSLLEDLEDLAGGSAEYEEKKKRPRARSQFLWHKRFDEFVAIASELLS